MTSNYTPKNYGLFTKYLSKIKKTIVATFGSKENIIAFLEEICYCGDIKLAAENKLKNLISPLLIYNIIKKDENLSKCVSLATSYAEDMKPVKAEEVLYKNAIDGCHKSLMAYLKSHSKKYQTGIKGISEIKKTDNIKTILDDTDIFEIEAYELGNEDK